LNNPSYRRIFVADPEVHTLCAMTVAIPAALKFPADAPWVWMEPGTSTTRVVYAAEHGAVQECVLPIGTQRVTPGPFRAAPPSPMELEVAIAEVEDVVMPLAKLLPAGAAFFVSSPGAEMALAGDALDLAHIEDRFNTLAAHSHGRPFSSDDPSIQPEAAALLLILREAMHHLGFSKVQLL
jgi:hypothetical protein